MIMDKKIIDVYAVRSDYLKQNRQQVAEFVHGLMLAQEKVIELFKNKSSKEYKTMNISHAVAILLYELFAYTHKETKFPPMTADEKRIIEKKIEKILNKMHFSTEDKRETQRRVWKRIIGKAMLTKREAFALIGFLRKLE